MSRRQNLRPHPGSVRSESVVYLGPRWFVNVKVGEALVGKLQPEAAITETTHQCEEGS